MIKSLRIVILASKFTKFTHTHTLSENQMKTLATSGVAFLLLTAYSYFGGKFQLEESAMKISTRFRCYSY